MDSNICYLSEIYSAIQGEGPLVGVRQIFVRFSACDLRCAWCDTPESLVRSSTYKFEINPAKRIFSKGNNPISMKKLLEHIDSLNSNYHHSISLTGGEPLLQANFLRNLLPILKNKSDLAVYLESGGHRPNELEKIIEFLDYVSMDIKLPSSAKTKLLMDEHNKFLSILQHSKLLKGLWVKIVITKDTNYDELFDSVMLVKASSKHIPIEVILQPVTPVNNLLPPSEKELLLLQSRLLEHYKFIRVIPQTHKFLGQK